MPSRPAPDFASAQESLVPARLRVRGGEVVGIVDHLGNDIGLPVTARKSDLGVGSSWDTQSPSAAGHVVYSALPRLNGHLPADGRTYSISAYPTLARRLGRISNGLGAFSNKLTGRDNFWRSVCWSPELGIFVAVAISGVGNRVMTSPDGVTWTARTTPNDLNWTSVCWSPEKLLFVATATTGVGNRVMTSPDGVAWTARTSAADSSWSSIVWAASLGLFVAVSDTGVVGGRVMTSPDGSAWSTVTTTGDQEWACACWSQELSLIVAVSYTDAGNRALTAYGCTYNPLTDFAVPKITAPAGCYAHILAG